jgi:DNA primase
LFGLLPELARQGATPVLVEGPLDAWAVTLATTGSHVGVAPLGTALTDEQAAQIAQLGRGLIVATDADLPGRVAAERDYWLLTQHGLDPAAATFPEGLDPADVLARQGSRALAEALAAARPLGELLLDERLTNLDGDVALHEAGHVVAARPPQCWDAQVADAAGRLGVPISRARARLAASVQAWNRDPRAAAHARLSTAQEVKARLAAIQESPATRWADLASEVDPRLIGEADWPALAAVMQLAHRDGHDVPATVRRLVEQEPLAEQPAQDLRYRLVAALPVDVAPQPPSALDGRPRTTGKEHDRQATGAQPSRRPHTPRR